MVAFLTENIGTIAVGLTLAGILAAIVAKLVRDKRQGKCAGCARCEGKTDCRSK